jgi:hypothetical protein
MDTMKLSHVFALALVLVLGASVALADSGVKSGPQKGEDLAGPFQPLNVTGTQAGKKACLYCSNGSNPVAMIFAREASPELAKLCKEIESCCEKNKDAKMGSFVVVCSDEDGLETKLKKMAKDNDLKKVVLSIDNPAGPEGYKVSKEADITVVLYVDRNVKANFTFKKGELKDKNIEEVIKAVPTIVKTK